LFRSIPTKICVMCVTTNQYIKVTHALSHRVASFEAMQIYGCTRTLQGGLCCESTVS
jgi:hypothetical protein